jgi:feruloyl esterase
MLSRVSTIIMFTAAAFGMANQVHAMECSDLAAFKLPNVAITVASVINQSEFAKIGLQVTSSTESLPAFCRVAATLTPAKDSSIKIEVWMPVANWNGRLQGVGNGGFAGSISYAGMIEAIVAGYATASTDTGHTGSVLSANWALNNRQSVIDYGYRAVHEMTVAAKAIVSLYYDKPAHHAYWNGCSQGGGQGLAEAQRYPRDYDGIVAGAPNNNMTSVRISGVWTQHAIHNDPTTFIANKKLAALNQAVVDACDEIDGVIDGVIDDPRRCTYDLARLRCSGPETDSCFTVPQIMGIQKIYGGAHGRHTGELIYPGFMFGSELLWAGQISGDEVPPRNQHHLKQNDFFKYIVFNDENWDWRKFDFRTDPDIVEKAVGKIVNNNIPDLTAFKKRDGKLLQYHGWYDPAISALDSIRYFEDVKANTKNANSFHRLFVVPGMGHCGGGPGISGFDKMDVIVQWVEHGKAPTQIVATKTVDETTKSRLLCPYPQTAKHNGTGNIDDAKSYRCVEKR